MAPWLSSDPSKRWAEKFFLMYSPVWMLAVGAVVVFKLYELFTAETYVLFSLSISIPCFLVPLLINPRSEKTLPLTQRFWFKTNVWVALFAFIGNYFFTHYFYTVLGCRYTLPVGKWELNGVPIVMYFMTHPYFCSYHIIATVVLRRLGVLHKDASFFYRAVVIVALAYFTAFTEAWSISAFPHYAYPSRELMFSVGSIFYALMFFVTYPAFAFLDETTSTRRTVGGFIEHSLACGMAVFLLFDAWRVIVGPIVETSSVGIVSVPFAQPTH